MNERPEKQTENGLFVGLVVEEPKKAPTPRKKPAAQQAKED